MTVPDNIVVGVGAARRGYGVFFFFNWWLIKRPLRESPYMICVNKISTKILSLKTKHTCEVFR